MTAWIEEYSRPGQCDNCTRWKPVIHVRLFSGVNVARLMTDQKLPDLPTTECVLCKECVTLLEGRHTGTSIGQKEG